MAHLVQDIHPALRPCALLKEEMEEAEEAGGVHARSRLGDAVKSAARAKDSEGDAWQGARDQREGGKEGGKREGGEIPFPLDVENVGVMGREETRTGVEDFHDRRALSSRDSLGQGVGSVGEGGRGWSTRSLRTLPDGRASLCGLPAAVGAGRDVLRGHA